MSLNSMRLLAVLCIKSGAEGYYRTNKIIFNNNAQQIDLKWIEDTLLIYKRNRYPITINGIPDAVPYFWDL